MTKSSNRFAEALKICQQFNRRECFADSDAGMSASIYFDEFLTIASELQAQKDKAPISNGRQNAIDICKATILRNGQTFHEVFPEVVATLSDKPPQPDQPSDESRDRASEAFERLLRRSDYANGRASGGGDWPFNRDSDIHTIRSALAQKPEPEAVDVMDIAKEICVKAPFTLLSGSEKDWEWDVVVHDTLKYLSSHGLLRVKERS